MDLSTYVAWTFLTLKILVVNYKEAYWCKQKAM